MSREDRLESLRERTAAAQEEIRRQSAVDAQRTRARWTEATTLVPLVTSGIAVVLSLYAIFRDQKRPDPSAPAVRSTERPVAHKLPKIGDIGRIDAPTVACFELHDYRRVRELAASDRAAADTYARQACGMFEPGLQVIVDKASESDNAVCARQVGLTQQCFWMSGEAFGKSM